VIDDGSTGASKRAEIGAVVEKPSSAFITGSGAAVSEILNVTGEKADAGMFSVPSVLPEK
jgi:hypothetical protein